MRWLPFILLASACNLLHDEVVTDEGRVCVAGDAVEITSPCVSACAENVDAGCSIRVAGDTVTIESHFAFDVPDSACIALCGGLETRCRLPALEPGTYTVRHGDDVATVAIGGAAAPACFGR